MAVEKGGHGVGLELESRGLEFGGKSKIEAFVRTEKGTGRLLLLTTYSNIRVMDLGDVTISCSVTMLACFKPFNSDTETW